MTTTFYEQWRDVPEGSWRWPNFSPAEIACRGTGKLLVNEGALDRLQALRDSLGKPFIVRSAYRSPEHNQAVGGAKRSKHMEGTPFDIAMSNHDPAAFETAAREAGFLGFGFYPRSDFMHIDLGPKREWAGAPSASPSCCSCSPSDALASAPGEWRSDSNHGEDRCGSPPDAGSRGSPASFLRRAGSPPARRSVLTPRSQIARGPWSTAPSSRRGRAGRR